MSSDRTLFRARPSARASARPSARRLVAPTAAVLAAGLLAPGLATPAGAATDGPEVMLGFESSTSARSTGSAGLTTRTVLADGGSVSSVAGPTGGGAVRLPAYTSGTSRKAAFSVVDRDGADDLEPGTSTFRFGADFTLDATSAGSRQDNGDNLVQRGLYNDAAQMKIEIDAGRPACRLKGSTGAVTVKSPVTVARNTWYRAICRKVGSKATLRLVRLSDGKVWARSATRSFGTFAYERSTPFSSGGKLASPTRFTGGSTDQFNGRVDRAFLDIS